MNSLQYQGVSTATVAPSLSPTDQPIPTSTSSPEAARCSASSFWQLAYELPGMEAAEVTCDIACKTVGEVELTLDRYLPPGASAGDALPVVVLVHRREVSDPLQTVNEPWKRDMYTHGIVAAASRMAAVAFDYRGYSSGDEGTLIDAQQDVLDLLSYVGTTGDELGIDGQRTCLWTSSEEGSPWRGPHCS